jgi:hypothetical protein
MTFQKDKNFAVVDVVMTVYFRLQISAMEISLKNIILLSQILIFSTFSSLLKTLITFCSIF